MPLFFKQPEFYSDDEAYRDMQMEMEDALISQALNPLHGIRNFSGISLSEHTRADPPANSVNTPVGQRIPIKIRVYNTLDSCIPNPCSEYSDQEKLRLISLHPVAYSTRPLGVGEAIPNFGQELNLRFADQGPILNGQHRGIQYDYATAKNQRVYNCLTGEMTVVDANYVTLYQDVPDADNVTTQVSNGKKIAGGLNFTWTQLKQLVSLGIFEPLLKHIREHECSQTGCATTYFNKNQYDAFNYKGGYKIGRTSYLPKPLSQYNIEEVRSYWQSKPVVNGEKMFASGGYQIIPKTLVSAIGRIKGLDTSETYNKTNQDALGIYLVTMKRQKLGKYLFGDNIDAADAGNELAFEFASIRLQKAATRKGKKIPAYVKYYGGVGSNTQGAADKADADRTMAAINQVRASIDSNSTARQIRDEALK